MRDKIPEGRTRVSVSTRQMVWMGEPPDTYTYWFGPGVCDIPHNVAEAYARKLKEPNAT